VSFPCMPQRDATLANQKRSLKRQHGVAGLCMPNCRKVAQVYDNKCRSLIRYEALHTSRALSHVREGRLFIGTQSFVFSGLVCMAPAVSDCTLSHNPHRIFLLRSQTWPLSRRTKPFDLQHFEDDIMRRHHLSGAHLSEAIMKWTDSSL